MKALTESERAACERMLPNYAGVARFERLQERVGVGIDNGMSEADATLRQPGRKCAGSNGSGLLMTKW